MKINWVLAVLFAAAAPASAALSDLGGILPPHYFRVGFDAVKGGLLFPIVGGLDRAQAAFIVPAIVHKAADGSLLVPGVDWNLLDLGYAGPVGGGTNVLHGSIAAGPSLNLGEPVKASLRAACRGLIPGWNEPGQFGALKAAFAPGDAAGAYLSVGTAVVYNLASRQVGFMGALTLNKTFGGPAAADKP